MYSVEYSLKWIHILRILFIEWSVRPSTNFQKSVFQNCWLYLNVTLDFFKRILFSIIQLNVTPTDRDRLEKTFCMTLDFQALF